MFTPIDLETMVFRRGFTWLSHEKEGSGSPMPKLTIDYEKLYKENNLLNSGKVSGGKDGDHQGLPADGGRHSRIRSVQAQGTAEEIKAAGRTGGRLFSPEAQNRAEQMKFKVGEEIQAELQQLNLKQQLISSPSSLPGS